VAGVGLPAKAASKAMARGDVIAVWKRNTVEAQYSPNRLPAPIGRALA
jgi:hypothetical protein